MPCTECTGCVLVVDDDGDTRDAVREIIEGIGCRVLTATDGIDALERLRTTRHRPCLVITDLNMPRLDGDGLAASLRRMAEHADTPLVTMSGDRARNGPSGVDVHLVKPFAPIDVRRTVARRCPDGPAARWGANSAVAAASP